MTIVRLNIDWLGNEVLAMLLCELSEKEEDNEQLNNDWEFMSGELTRRMGQDDALLLEEIAQDIPLVMRKVFNDEKDQYRQWLSDLAHRLGIRPEVAAP